MPRIRGMRVNNAKAAATSRRGRGNVLDVKYVNRATRARKR
jgi:hypothetical protein